ncbi:hypothetical protein PSYPI_36799, partial [Pseudomonas syringae pv. pisi str. 1704B]
VKSTASALCGALAVFIQARDSRLRGNQCNHLWSL